MREIHGRHLGHPTGRDGVGETVTNAKIGIQMCLRNFELCRYLDVPEALYF